METPELTPKMAGRFTLYNTPDGGFHVAYKADNSEKTEHIEIPGALIRASQMLDKMKAEGKSVGPMQIFKILGPVLGMGQ